MCTSLGAALLHVELLGGHRHRGHLFRASDLGFVDLPSSLLKLGLQLLNLLLEGHLRTRLLLLALLKLINLLLHGCNLLFRLLSVLLLDHVLAFFGLFEACLELHILLLQFADLSCDVILFHCLDLLLEIFVLFSEAVDIVVEFLHAFDFTQLIDLSLQAFDFGLQGIDL